MPQLTISLSDTDAGHIAAVAMAQGKPQDEITQQALRLGLSLLMAREGIGGEAVCQDALEAGFGIWKGRADVPADGLAYQLATRAEWP